MVAVAHLGEDICLCVIGIMHKRWMRAVWYKAAVMELEGGNVCAFTTTSDIIARSSQHHGAAMP